MEDEFPFKLTPEQKSILLLWFGADSKFGWTKLDFLLGAHRVHTLYPDHRSNAFKSDAGFSYEPDFDISYGYDGYSDPIINIREEDFPF